METIEDLIFKIHLMLLSDYDCDDVVQIYNDLTETDKYRYIGDGFVKKIDGDN